MMARHVLDVLIPLLLGLFALVMGVRFFLTLRHRGLRAAAQQFGSRRVLLSLSLFAGLGLLRESVVFIDPREVGVVTSLISPGGIRPRPLHAGVHLIVPLLEHLDTYPIITQVYTMSSHREEGDKLGDDSIEARTADGQLVRLDVSLLFRVDPSHVVDLHRYYQNRYIEVLLRPGLRSLVRQEASRYNVDEINSSRRVAFQEALDANIRQVCSALSVIIEAVMLRNVSFSPEYADSVERKMMALQEVTESLYKANSMANLADGEARRIVRKAEAQAQARVIGARAQAQATVLHAEADAQALKLLSPVLETRPDLLTYRYIERLSPALQAMLLPAESPLILPLPQWLQESVAP